MRRILVTGSEGYIGSVVMPMLLRHGYRVDGLDTCWYAHGQLVPLECAWRCIQKDIRDLEPEELSRYWAIVHLAALCNDHVGQLDPDVTLDVNYRATVRLAEMARRVGVRRFVYSSSCSMYGVASRGAADESAPLKPQTAYAESKVLAERELSKLATDRFSPVCLRNATAYGISPRQRFDLVIPSLAGFAHTTGSVRILSDGTPWRPIVHIRDIGRAIRCALEAPQESIHNESFNIGSEDQNFQIRDIAQAVARAFGGCEISYGPPADKPDTRSYQVSFAKARQRLTGFRTSWSVEDGAVECARTFRRIGLTEETFQHRLFTRLKQLRYLIESNVLDGKLRKTTTGHRPCSPMHRRVSAADLAAASR